MSVISNIQKAKAPIDKLKESTTAIHEWVEKVNKLEEEGKDLSELQKTFKGVKIFGKLSTSLTVASIGLDVALYFFGEEAPGPNAEVLKAIDALDEKVAGLWSDMDLQFTILKEHVDVDFANASILPALNNFSELHNQVIMYRRTKSKASLNYLVSNICEPSVISRDFNSIKNAVTNSLPAQNPLKSNYIATNGDARTIIKFGKAFLGLCTFVPLAYTLTAALRHLKNPTFNDILTAEDAHDNFQHNIEAISDQVNHYMEKCQNEVAKNVQLDLDKKWGSKLPEDLFKASKFLRNKFSKKYYWLDWAVSMGQGDLHEGKDYSLVGKELNRIKTWKSPKGVTSITVVYSWQLKTKITSYLFQIGNKELSSKFREALAKDWQVFPHTLQEFTLFKLKLINGTMMTKLATANANFNNWIEYPIELFASFGSDFDVVAIVYNPEDSISGATWAEDWSENMRTMHGINDSEERPKEIMETPGDPFSDFLYSEYIYFSSIYRFLALK